MAVEDGILSEDMQDLARVAPSKLEGGYGVVDAPESIALSNPRVIMDELTLSVGVIEDRPAIE
ncbi:hypothetical protein JCGZ_18604 [Jatropha curcas]|uniref:Uncharacterized protein n=1 Tax=Jatropha curcas TaxID=180498 RepID=A0A067K4P1_JATCU|nr:hypothetical protein JCGZ_18604 [Jatropha curcas]